MVPGNGFSEAGIRSGTVTSMVWIVTRPLTFGALPMAPEISRSRSAVADTVSVLASCALRAVTWIAPGMP